MGGMGGPPPGMGGPPREAVLFVPPHLTGMIIGKAGVMIKGLRQEAGEMECNIDLQQDRQQDGGDGSAKIIITGANGNDVMVQRETERQRERNTQKHMRGRTCAYSPPPPSSQY